MTTIGTVCTTLKIEDGHPCLLPLHLARLRHFAKLLKRSFCVSSTRAQVERIAHNVGRGVLRIELNSEGAVECIPRSSPKKRVSTWALVQRTDLEISGYKRVNRTRWNDIKRELSVDILVLQSAQGNYLECCIGNLFIYRPSSNQWFTPSLDVPILPGIARSVLLSQAKSNGFEVLETCISPQSEDQLWMSNAVRGLVPLSNVNNHTPPPLWKMFDQRPNNIDSIQQHFHEALERALYW